MATRIAHPPAPSGRKAESGFSLVEVVTAAAILGIAVSALTAMIGNSDVLQLVSDHYRQARIIVQHELEDPWTHYLHYADLVPGDGRHPPEDMSLDLNAEGLTPITARDSVAVTAELKADFGDNVKIPYKTVKSVVTWTERSGKTLSVVLGKRVVDVQ